MKPLVLSANSTAAFIGKVKTKGISCALSALSRDWEMVFSSPLEIQDGPGSFDIEIINEDNGIDDESFRVELADDGVLKIVGGNELGTIFGIYYFSEHILKIDPYYLWTDSSPQRRDQIVLEPFEYVSPKPAVRFRGWFINGEDCLIGWSGEDKISMSTWTMVFETMLRSRYNMVIPGTAVPFSDPQMKLASDMGLWITHHHAEPLGAKMFLKAFPEANPDPAVSREKYETLYREAIEGYLENNSKVVFVLGFRGQGDIPFWENSTAYDTPEKRAAVINDMVRSQKKLITEISNGKYKHFSLYIYGESAEFAKAGLLDYDDDTILIWSDNGYGAMRMRRMGPEEPGIEVLPLVDSIHPLHGFYYHINFHDLQASNQLTMLVEPEIIVDQFRKCFEKGVNDYMILNVGNVRPHVFEIEMISKLSFEGIGEKSDAEIISESYRDFCVKHFEENADGTADIYRGYFKAPFVIGPTKDSKAGDEAYHYAIRSMIHKVIGNARWKYFMHVGDPKMPFDDRLLWYMDKAGDSQSKWDKLADDFEKVKQTLTGRSRQYFSDNIGMQIYFNKYSNKALYNTAKIVQAYAKDDTSAENLYNCFIEISKVKWLLEKALDALIATEHGKWKNFYRADWYAAVRMTIRFVRTFQSIARIRGESHPYETWFHLATEPSALKLRVLGSKKIDDDDEYARFLIENPSRPFNKTIVLD